MKPCVVLMAGLLSFSCVVAAAPEFPGTWPPRDYLVRCLADAVPEYLKGFHADTGRFGSEPWICTDQNVIFPLAAAWAIQEPGNPWYHSAQVLEAVGRGGEALIDAMDEKGKWTFRKKDHSTWGQIHMPWTYSRWIRAYALVRDALPAATRERWEKALLLGFTGIRRYADGDTHNIPTHHAMALYIAGVCFENEAWKTAAKQFMARVVSAQDPGGFWSEHFGPVVGYNKVYIDALGIYYHFSRDAVVLDALERSARFHAGILWPDGSAVSCIDERQIYHQGVDTGNVGFSYTPEGRGFLVRQLQVYSRNGEKNVDGDYAASMLLYGGTGDAVLPASMQGKGIAIIGAKDALIQRCRPWQWAFSGYACAPANSRWIQDRQNLVDVYHDGLGLIIGGGNTKLQPYWSSFTVGEPSRVAHVPGDESPDFTPDIPLFWTPSRASIDDARSAMTLQYGDVECAVSASVGEDGALTLTYAAPPGKRAEAHVPFLKRADAVHTAAGNDLVLTEDAFILTGQEIGGGFTFGGLSVIVPGDASLRWPAKQHNPYAKDGKSKLADAKLVVVLPFEAVGKQDIVLSRHHE